MCPHRSADVYCREGDFGYETMPLSTSGGACMEHICIGMLMHCPLHRPLTTPLGWADEICAQCLRADLLRAVHGVPRVVGAVKYTGCECSESMPFRPQDGKALLGRALQCSP